MVEHMYLTETFSRKLYLLGLFDAATRFHHANKAVHESVSFISCPNLYVSNGLTVTFYSKDRDDHLFVSATLALTGPEINQQLYKSINTSHDKGF